MDATPAWVKHFWTRASTLASQARSWAHKNRPMTVTGWLGVCAAAGVVSAVTSLSLVVAFVLIFCALVALLGAAFIFGITLGFWLCVSAWMALAFSALTASLAAWLLVAQVGLGLLRTAGAAWQWLPWLPAASAALGPAKAPAADSTPADSTAALAVRTPPGPEPAPSSQRPLDGEPRSGGVGGSGDAAVLVPGSGLYCRGGGADMPDGPADAPQRPPSPPVTAAAPPSASPSPSTSFSSLSPPSPASPMGNLEQLPPLQLPPPGQQQQQQRATHMHTSAQPQPHHRAHEG